MNKACLIPPPIIFILCAFLMKWLPPIFVLPVPHTFSLIVATLGCFIGLFAAWQFLHHKTTPNPIELTKSSYLITNGVFSLSRNPMYLSLLIVLIAWAFYLTSVSAFLGVGFCFIYLNYWQIPAEERALCSLFGAQYVAYCQQARRRI